MRMVSRCLQVAPMLATRFVQIGLLEPFRFSLRNLVSLQSMSWSVAPLRIVDVSITLCSAATFLHICLLGKRHELRRWGSGRGGVYDRAPLYRRISCGRRILQQSGPDGKIAGGRSSILFIGIVWAIFHQPVLAAVGLNPTAPLGQPNTMIQIIWEWQSAQHGTPPCKGQPPGQEPGTQLSWGDQEGPEIFTVDLSVFVLTPGLSRTARQSWVLAFHSAFHHSSSQQHSPVPRSFASVPKDWKYVNGFHCALQRAQVPWWGCRPPVANKVSQVQMFVNTGRFRGLGPRSPSCRRVWFTDKFISLGRKLLHTSASPSSSSSASSASSASSESSSESSSSSSSSSSSWSSSSSSS